MRDNDWKYDAACRGYDTNRWFPAGAQPPDDLALKLCAHCPVATQCLDYSFGGPGDRIEFGYWGGMGEDERQQERRRRQRRVGAAG